MSRSGYWAWIPREPVKLVETSNDIELYQPATVKKLAHEMNEVFRIIFKLN